MRAWVGQVTVYSVLRDAHAYVGVSAPGAPSGKIRVVGGLSGAKYANGSGYLSQIHFQVVGLAAVTVT